MPAKVVNVIDREEVCRTKEDADGVVVSFHWGAAYRAPAPYQPELAHAVIEAGADLVVGHHAHILQGVKVYQEMPIFYSLSNFVFDRDNPRYGRETTLVTARFGTEGLERVAVRPAIIPLRGDPRPASPSGGKSVKAQLESLSTGMNSHFEWDGSEIEITTAESRPK